MKTTTKKNLTIRLINFLLNQNPNKFKGTVYKATPKRLSNAIFLSNVALELKQAGGYSESKHVLGQPIYTFPNFDVLRKIKSELSK